MPAKATMLETVKAPPGTDCHGGLVRLLPGRIKGKTGGNRVHVQVSWPGDEVEFPVEILEPAAGGPGVGPRDFTLWKASVQAARLFRRPAAAQRALGGRRSPFGQRAICQGGLVAVRRPAIAERSPPARAQRQRALSSR